MKVITVSQLNRYIKTLLEGDRNVAAVHIGGEISNFTNHYKSGHLYMSLKDENALVRAVMFRGAASKLTFTPENGMKVIVKARVSLYEKDGSYQLYIDSMQPDGVGALQVAFEQLKTKLAAEGLFDESHKRPLPRCPRTVGVITSPTGAAVRDILNVLGRRFPMAKVLFAPVLVQGDGAPPQIVDAIRRMGSIEEVDVLIVGRGGGSLEELWAFNDERVARAVYASTVPVISAVGHETDFTICDFAADLRAPTPSAAAELAVPDAAALWRTLESLSERAEQSVLRRLDREQHRLKYLQDKRCLRSPLFYVEERQMRLDLLTQSLLKAAGTHIQRASVRLASDAAKLDALSPLKVLGRGYAIPYKTDKTVLTSVHDVTPGDHLEIQLRDGAFTCTVDA
ncbi:MAG: exodeoxyribonuclease VII large subunit [Clostridia bacterium]|nr:exodeoxyribonuclease VII large subunit [Clostridia bacterium]